ncbi:PAAR domain-containing protein [Herbaspirillum seropedicae]|uniref:PAAR domain-containing protein n=1 Tax=Herbaspirillum seropedicae (strain SmR1) TaxID=757424 RepID=D8IYM2_HERSS|nr:PAAR domain-containing protein [Herbaspirillum seropedicae]ADJ64207.1 conserved hypothetical protein [Herbaspirillum seropedicae SmR1]UMU22151.1 PAAR domain-containing protein [Herbaspirillum seropedicae]
MSSAIIRKGDSTSHGGTVLEGLVSFNVLGLPAALVGHMVYCPRCKGSYAIVEGVRHFRCGGNPVAVAGMKTACGAELQASQSAFLIGASASPVAAPLRATEASDEEVIEHWYSLEDGDGNPIEGYLFDVYQQEKMLAQECHFLDGRSVPFAGDASGMVMWLAGESEHVAKDMS